MNVHTVASLHTGLGGQRSCFRRVLHLQNCDFTRPRQTWQAFNLPSEKNAVTAWTVSVSVLSIQVDVFQFTTVAHALQRYQSIVSHSNFRPPHTINQWHIVGRWSVQFDWLRVKRLMLASCQKIMAASEQDFRAIKWTFIQLLLFTGLGGQRSCFRRVLLLQNCDSQVLDRPDRLSIWLVEVQTTDVGFLPQNHGSKAVQGEKVPNVCACYLSRCCGDQIDSSQGSLPEKQRARI